MPDPAKLRDSTQIVLPATTLDGHREAIEAEFTVTFVDEAEHVRIIGSPVVIKRVSDYLARQGIGVL